MEIYLFLLWIQRLYHLFLSWIQSLCHLVYELFVPNTIVYGDLPSEVVGPNTMTDIDLPCELVADILSRLPANCIAHCVHASKPLLMLTRTPSFISMHLNRASPVIAFQHFATREMKWVKKYAKEVSVGFSDETMREVASSERTIVDFSSSCRWNACLPLLCGSCDGFLIFRNLGYGSVLFLWNPATREKVSVIAPHDGYCACGLFFHSTAKEYRVVYVSATKDKRQFEFYILSLKTKSLRLVTRSRHPPTGVRPPIIVNGALHWLTSDYSYHVVNGDYPLCYTNSIVIFDMNSEEVSTMGHPGLQCEVSKEPHSKMKLMEKDEKLWFVNDFEYGKIVMWMLEDYDKRFWVKMHVINVGKPSFEFCGRFCRCKKHERPEALHMFGDELLVIVFYRDLYLYNLKVGGVRRFGMNVKDSGLPVSAVAHVGTLLSLETEEVIQPFKDQRKLLGFLPVPF